MAKSRRLQRYEEAKKRSSRHTVIEPGDCEVEVGYLDREENLPLIVRRRGFATTWVLMLDPVAAGELLSDLRDTLER